MRTMSTVVAMSAAVFLVGCSEQATKSDSGPPATSDRWMIVGNSEGFAPISDPTNRHLPAVWRLDRQTGKLDFCYVSDALRCQSDVPNP